MKFTYKIDVLGAENLKSIDITYYEVFLELNQVLLYLTFYQLLADGSKGPETKETFKTGDFDFNKEDKVGTANLTGLVAGKTYEALIVVNNDKIGSEPQKIKFEMKPDTSSSTATVIGVMLGIIIGKFNFFY